MYPETLKNLIECYKRHPGIGEKSAERMALFCLDADDEMLQMFADSLTSLKKKVKRCKNCNNLTENEICDICSDEDRNDRVVLVVESIKDLFTIERINEYKR